jgi:hypothetical protein
MNGAKILLLLWMIAITLCGLVAVSWTALWFNHFNEFPPEHVYVSVESPDGSQVANFSIKYQGISPWIPTDIEPAAYITVIETRHGSIVERHTEYRSSIKKSFSELAKEYAPWALEEIDSLKW